MIEISEYIFEAHSFKRLDYLIVIDKQPVGIVRVGAESDEFSAQLDRKSVV